MPTYNSQDDAVVNLDDTGGSLADVSDYVKEVMLDHESNIGRFAVLGQRYEKTTEGTSRAKGTLTVYQSVDAAGAHYLITHWLMNSTTNKAGLKSLRIQTPDAAAGSFQFDCEIRPASYNEVVTSAGEGNPGEHQLSFEVDGAVTWSVIS